MSAITTNTGSSKLYIERIGVPKAFSNEIPEKEFAALMGAIYLSAGAKKAVPAADPTPEEMLAIGIAIGLQQNTQSVSRAPKMTPWKMAARLRM